MVKDFDDGCLLLVVLWSCGVGGWCWWLVLVFIPCGGREAGSEMALGEGILPLIVLEY